jgi:cyclic pyranopterin phosphate synthase
MDVHYLRFVLHADTDGILLSKKRPEPVRRDLPELEELHELLQLFAARGACKVRLMGDDPAKRTDLLELVATMRGIEGVGEVALTTRGHGLEGRIPDLARAGLRSINLNLDTLRAERYEALVGQDGHAGVLRALDESLAAGLRVKINCVLQAGVNLDEVDAFVGLTRERPIEVRFVEWDATTDRIPPPEAFVPTADALALVKPSLLHREPEPFAGPAIRFEIPGHAGGLAFIPNVTDHFCADCNRLVFTDHGELASCIFGRGANLLRLLRSSGAIESVDAYIDRVVRRKVMLAARMSGWDAPGASAHPPSLS